MPEEDVSDLRDVVDAINKLCETMKTSYDEYEDCDDVHEGDNIVMEGVEPNEVVFEKVHTYITEKWCDTEQSELSPEQVEDNLDSLNVEVCTDKTYSVIEPSVAVSEIYKPVPLKFETCKIDRSNVFSEPAVTCSSEQAMIDSVAQSFEAHNSSGMVIEPLASTSEPTFEKIRSYKSDRGDVIIIKKPAVATDIEVARNIVTEKFEELETILSDVETVQCEPISEMYYTASSEVSLLSDVDFQDKAQTEDSDKEKDDRNSVITGHVAAMRERFESMTRTNTPCPDLMRSTSPSFEVFRNISNSPDKLE